MPPAAAEMVMPAKNQPPSKRQPTTKPADKPPAPKQIRQFNIRLDLDTSARVESVAALLGLDEANLLRMIVKENLKQYEDRADKLKPPDKS